MRTSRILLIIAIALAVVAIALITIGFVVSAPRYYMYYGMKISYSNTSSITALSMIITGSCLAICSCVMFHAFAVTRPVWYEDEEFEIPPETEEN